MALCCKLLLSIAGGIKGKAAAHNANVHFFALKCKISTAVMGRVFLRLDIRLIHLLYPLRKAADIRGVMLIYIALIRAKAIVGDSIKASVNKRP